MLIAASASGSGKTAVVCGLLRVLQRWGVTPCAFKCGPDYIDPMFHRAAVGVDSRNLDLFLYGGEERTKALFARGCQGHGAAVCEGVMGYYDGLGGTTDWGSSWHTATTLGLPVLLVLRVKGASLSLAAQIQGLCAFRKPHGIRGVILNECSPTLCRTLSPVLERETGIPVLGCLPRLDAAAFSSRHLGLYTAAEIADLDSRLNALADALEENVDMARLMERCELPRPEARMATMSDDLPQARIAVAQDEAFCFCYAETLEALRENGAEIVYFSPLRDTDLPGNCGGLYLPGGYPELYAKALSENAPMRESITAAVRSGRPTVAECGGFLYLGASMADGEGNVYPMAGVLPGESKNAGRLVRFGYETLCAESDSLLFRRGERIPAHEFHYWDSTENGTALRVKKPVSGRSWRCGYTSDSLYAAFPHLSFGGRPELAARFVEAARRYQEEGHGTAELAETNRPTG